MHSKILFKKIVPIFFGGGRGDWMGQNALCTFNTYTFPGPVIVLQHSDVQYSDTTPYTRFTWLKKDIADGENNAKFEQKMTSKMPILYKKYIGPEVPKNKLTHCMGS